jgi:hypothetical protein
MPYSQQEDELQVLVFCINAPVHVKILFLISYRIHVQVFYWTSTAHSFLDKPGALVSNGKCFLFGSGGIVFWADLVGPKHVYDSLKKWSQRFGDFYKPSKFLEERATGGIPLVRALSSCLLLLFMHLFTLKCITCQNDHGDVHDISCKGPLTTSRSSLQSAPASSSSGSRSRM